MEEIILGPIQTKWLESLEQNPHRQITSVLGQRDRESANYGACCLGELGLIAGTCKWNEDDDLVEDYDGDEFHYPTYTLDGRWKELGLYGPAGETANCVKVEGFTSLAAMNDGDVLWPDIARIVRANPEKFFSKSF